MNSNNRLNIDRLKLIRKGYVNQKELSIFLHVGKTKARQAYVEIENQIHKEGKKTDILGLPISRVLSYINLTEGDLRRFAEDEERQVILNDS